MTLRNCRHCGQLFLRQQSDSCANCQDKHEGYYGTVRDYIRSHPSSTLMDVHRGTGIPMATLLDMQKGRYLPFAR